MVGANLGSCSWRSRPRSCKLGTGRSSLSPKYTLLFWIWWLRTKGLWRDFGIRRLIPSGSTVGCNLQMLLTSNWQTTVKPWLLLTGAEIYKKLDWGQPGQTKNWKSHFVGLILILYPFSCASLLMSKAKHHFVNTTLKTCYWRYIKFWTCVLFMFQTCQVNLEGQSFFAKGGKPYCKKHASTRQF